MESKAQVASEYVIIIIIVGVALAAMSLYFRRSIQAVVKLAADEVGAQKDSEIVPEEGQKQDGRSHITTVSSLTQNIIGSEGGVQNRTIDSTSTSSGTSNYTTEREQP